MNMKDIYTFMEKAENSSYDEISVEMDGVKISLKKNAPVQNVVQTMPAAMPMMAMAGNTMMTNPMAGNTMANAQNGMTQSVAENATASTGVANNSADDDSIAAVKAPFVGTFYRAASPKDKPFVMVGQEVKKGDVVGIIEAMKLMNEITATEDGIVEAIEVEDGTMVEYNQNLVLIKKVR